MFEWGQRFSRVFLYNSTAIATVPPETVSGIPSSKVGEYSAGWPGKA